MKQQEKKKNNKGFSLVELIVTILIIGILAGGTVVSVSIIYNANVKSAADNLVAMLGKARNEAIARQDGEVYLVVYNDEVDEDGNVSGNYYASVFYQQAGTVEKIAEQKLGNSRLTFSQADWDSTTKNAGYWSGSGDATDALTFHFSRSSGGITENVKDINISGSKTMKIIVVRETGRCYSEE